MTTLMTAALAHFFHPLGQETTSSMRIYVYSRVRHAGRRSQDETQSYTRLPVAFEVLLARFFQRRCPSLLLTSLA